MSFTVNRYTYANIIDPEKEAERRAKKAREAEAARLAAATVPAPAPAPVLRVSDPSPRWATLDNEDRAAAIVRILATKAELDAQRAKAKPRRTPEERKARRKESALRAHVKYEAKKAEQRKTIAEARARLADLPDGPEHDEERARLEVLAQLTPFERERNRLRHRRRYARQLENLLASPEYLAARARLTDDAFTSGHFARRLASAISSAKTTDQALGKTRTSDEWAAFEAKVTDFVTRRLMIEPDYLEKWFETDEKRRKEAWKTGSRAIAARARREERHRVIVEAATQKAQEREQKEFDTLRNARAKVETD